MKFICKILLIVLLVVASKQQLNAQSINNNLFPQSPYAFSYSPVFKVSFLAPLVNNGSFRSNNTLFTANNNSVVSNNEDCYADSGCIKVTKGNYNYPAQGGETDPFSGFNDKTTKLYFDASSGDITITPNDPTGPQPGLTFGNHDNTLTVKGFYATTFNGFYIDMGDGNNTFTLGDPDNNKTTLNLYNDSNGHNAYIRLGNGNNTLNLNGTLNLGDRLKSDHMNDPYLTTGTGHNTIALTNGTISLNSDNLTDDAYMQFGEEGSGKGQTDFTLNNSKITNPDSKNNNTSRKLIAFDSKINNLILNKESKIEGIKLAFNGENNTIILNDTSAITNTNIVMKGTNNTVTLNNDSNIGSRLDNKEDSALDFEGAGNNILNINTTNDAFIKSITTSYTTGTTIINVNNTLSFQSLNLLGKSASINVAKEKRLQEEEGGNITFAATTNCLLLSQSSILTLARDSGPLIFSGNDNTLTLDKGAIINGSNNQGLLDFESGNNLINIYKNVVLKADPGTTQIKSSQNTNVTLNMYNVSNPGYNFDFSSSNNVTLNLYATPNGEDEGLALGHASHIQLSQNGNNLINLYAYHATAGDPHNYLSLYYQTITDEYGAIHNASINIFNNQDNSSKPATVQFKVTETDKGLILKGDTANFTINDTNFSFIKDGNTPTTGNRIIIKAKKSVVNINSQHQSVTINLNLDKDKEAGTLDASKSQNATLNLNFFYNWIVRGNNPYFPNLVTIQGTVLGFNNINLGLTTLTLDDYKQGDKDLNLTTSITSKQYNEDSSAIINGNIVVKNSMDFNNKPINVGLLGVYNLATGSTMWTPFTLTLISSKDHDKSDLLNLNPDNIHFESSVFEFTPYVDLSDNSLKATVTKCATFDEALKGIGCGDKPGPETDKRIAPKTVDPNIEGLATSLEIIGDSGLAGEMRADVKSILDTAYNTSENNGGLTKFFTTLEPVNNEVLLNLSAVSDKSFISSVFNQAGINKGEDTKTWFSNTYNVNKIKDTNYIPGVKLRSDNFSGGIEKVIKGNIIGGAAGITFSKIKSSNNLYKGDVKALNLGVYHKFKINKNVVIKSMAAYSFNSFDIKRHIMSTGHKVSALDIDEHANAAPFINALSLNSVVEYKQPMFKMLTAPLIASTYAEGSLNYYGMSRYKETGFGALDVKGFSSAGLDAKLGGGLEQPILLGSQIIVPAVTVEAGYKIYRLGNTSAQFVGAENFIDSNFTNYRPKYSHLILSTNFNINYIISKLVSSNLYIRNNLSKSAMGLNVGVNVKVTL